MRYSVLIERRTYLDLDASSEEDARKQANEILEELEPSIYELTPDGVYPRGGLDWDLNKSVIVNPAIDPDIEYEAARDLKDLEDK